MRELADHILDLTRNAVEAGASEVLLTVAEDLSSDRLEISIADNGRGRDAATVAQVTDAFFTTRHTRRQGLGLPRFAATCQRCGGDLKIDSAPGHGTTVRGWMQASHLDRPPLGDLGAVVQALALETGLGHWRYEQRVGERRFVVDSAEMRREARGERREGETAGSDGGVQAPALQPETALQPGDLVRLREMVNEKARELADGT